jgi:nitrate reductase molybdenum cofactor assembly chaperone
MGAGTGKNLYTLLAGLLEYPREDLRLKAEEAIKALSAAQPPYSPEALDELSKFQKDLGHISLEDLQGVYSYTFELTSDFSLDLGFHIFDGFKRANSLASIKAMYRENGFPFEEYAKGELPDNLPVVLSFLGFVQDEALKKNFRETFAILAVEKLAKNFSKNHKNIYSHLISAIYRVLDKDVKEVK